MSETVRKLEDDLYKRVKELERKVEMLFEMMLAGRKSSDKS